MDELNKNLLDINKSLDNLLELCTMFPNGELYAQINPQKLLSIHRFPYDFYEDLFNVEDYLISNNKNVNLYKNLEYIVSNIYKVYAIFESAYYFKDYYENHTVEAINIVSDFIMEKDVPTEKVFFHLKGIYEGEFKAAVEAVKNTDPYLYQKYEERMENDYEIRFNAVVNRFREIAKGIETGFLSDGKKFDVLEFWRLVPFMYSKGAKRDWNHFEKFVPFLDYYPSDQYPGAFRRKISHFLKAALPEKYNVIMDYIKDNGIYSYTYMSYRSYRKIHNGGSVRFRGLTFSSDSNNVFEDAYANGWYGKKYDGTKKMYDNYYINNKIQKAIIKEMRERKLPRLLEVYSLLEEKYIKEFNNGQTLIENNNENRTIIKKEITEEQKQVKFKNNAKALMKCI